ncbi:MAG TPA: hypothetical protein H9980_00580 [Candidatus Erysipelatoclostridium merdavium]|uniref:Uncharacterized protein n=1 Tax=Candidatus Erysipelatoclostridium merdavium TaxID=2838566 RepID=A0A9D2BMC3_9FIRM|nr:hypothetical protein [Candidatus Erysipelatoclostridium merdavium]
MYDPWSKITTRNGYAGDEVISALQKSIRRGLEGQPRYTMLYKEKRNMVTGEITVQYDRLTPKNQP